MSKTHTDTPKEAAAAASVPVPAQRHREALPAAPAASAFPPRRAPRGGEDARKGERRKGDRRKRAGSPPKGMAERRTGPRRLGDRRRRGRSIALLLALLALCLASPDASQADSCEGDLRAPIELSFYGRPRESTRMALTTCEGAANEAVLDAFSVLMRPHGAHADRSSSAHGFVGEGIRRFDPRLLQRLQAIADHFPGHAIKVVSGYRAHAREGSRHHHAEALDIRVEGVHRAEVAAFARTLEGTGVGFYPASTFTHIDVRHHQSFWVDESAPGEPSRYAPNDEEDERLATVLREIRQETEVARVVIQNVRAQLRGPLAAAIAESLNGASNADGASLRTDARATPPSSDSQLQLTIVDAGLPAQEPAPPSDSDAIDWEVPW